MQKNRASQSSGNKTDKTEQQLVIRQSAERADSYLAGWAQQTMDRINQGEPCFLVGSYSPGEIFKAMDIPTTNNLGAFYYGGNLISSNDPKAIAVDEEEPFNLCSKCLPIDVPPLERLPKLAGIVTNEYECIGCTRALQSMVRRHNLPLFLLESTASPPFYPRYPKWWLNMEDQWDKVFEPERLDNMVEQIKSLIRFLELATGKEFRMNRLVEVLEETNRGAHYIRQARDLIAKTVPFPVGLMDIMKVIGVWQSQHGDPEVTALMKTFYEEVQDRVNNGQAVCKQEKLRLQWVKSWWGKNTSFYRAFEDKYGAVFGAAWYLSTGAEAYARSINDKDPLRALASRTLFMGVYSGPDWDIHLARLHGIDGAMMHTNQADFVNCYNGFEMGTSRQLHQMAFAAAGIPMLLIDPAWSMEKVMSEASRFIETLLMRR